jgi:hypothetical protein
MRDILLSKSPFGSLHSLFSFIVFGKLINLDLLLSNIWLHPSLQIKSKHKGKERRKSNIRKKKKQHQD